MAEHDYSDSDDDQRARQPAAPTREDPVRVLGSPSSSAPRSTGPRVKLTFRPNLTHLMNDDPPSQSSQPLPPSDRSSLSPPPPLTLKLGRPPPRPTDRARYSDSSDDDSHSTITTHTSTTNPKRPAKKPKLESGSPGKKPAAGEGGKKYDWLAPSVLGASHHGPPERGGAVSPTIPSEKEGRRFSGWAPGEDYVSQVSVETKKKSRPDRPPGLGKAWRKGIKKGMPMPTREDFSGSYTPGDATPISRLSPEPQDVTAPTVPRAPSPPFVKADPAVLGFPVFKRPVVPPKLNLTAFPKVSPVFSPINGGDVGPFPRKEPVRRWKMKERVLVGIGGSPLRFTTWAKDGPPSELSRLVRADKEARELALKKAKAAGTVGERPPLMSTISSDSTPTSSNLAMSLVQEEKEDTASEIGDGEESVASLTFNENGTAATSLSGTPPPGGVPKRKSKGPAKPKAGPRKSKLAQEIKAGSEVGSASDAIEDIM